MNERKARMWFAVFALAVFCTGAGAGFVAGRLLPGPPFGGLRGGPPGPPPPAELAERLGRDLDLSAGQLAQLARILESRRAGLEQLQRDVRARFDAEQQALRVEIAGILTAEQHKRFDDWLSRWPGAPEGPGAGGGPPPPGPGGPPGRF